MIDIPNKGGESEMPANEWKKRLATTAYTAVLTVAIPLGALVLWGSSAGTAKAAIGDQVQQFFANRFTTLQQCTGQSIAQIQQCKATERASETPPIVNVTNTGGVPASMFRFR